MPCPMTQTLDIDYRAVFAVASNGMALTRAVTHRILDLNSACTSRQAAPEMLGIAQAQKVALVFGSETYGLSNEQLMKCRWLINIPSNRNSSWPATRRSRV